MGYLSTDYHDLYSIATLTPTAHFTQNLPKGICSLAAGC